MPNFCVAKIGFGCVFCVANNAGGRPWVLGALWVGPGASFWPVVRFYSLFLDRFIRMASASAPVRVVGKIVDHFSLLDFTYRLCGCKKFHHVQLD